MKYVITESKINDIITSYLYELFDVDNINSTNPLEYDDDTEEEWEDENRVEFYIGDYSDEDTCFRWYDCDYFYPGTDAKKICPQVILEPEYSTQLTSYFGELWKEPFKKWFYENFDLPVKTVDW